MQSTRRFLATALCHAVALQPVLVHAASVKKTLPEGTRVYLGLNELVSGKRSEADVGQKVQCSIWRDVVHENVVLVKAGTPALCKVESIRHASIAGIKGKMSIGALETTAVDGQTVQLDGGHMKEGKSRMALSISLGAILFLPLIFIPGKAAELPDGTLFDSFTGPSTAYDVGSGAPDTRVISLAGVSGRFTADVDYDFLASQEKPKVFRLNLASDTAIPNTVVVDAVNGQAIESALPTTIISNEATPDGSTAVAEVDMKALSKHFQKGINRFDVAYQDESGRVAAEVILNIQI